MTTRSTLLALVLCGMLPHATAADDSAPWRGAVEGPRGLPSVDVEVGYPGGYVSRTTSPVVLRIRTGDRPFDGYVGFHLAVADRRTIDARVMTRVVLPPRAEQLFSTWHFITAATPSRYLSLSARQLMIEWRNRSMKVVASRSAGVPPWRDAQPLRIAAAAARPVNATYLGTPAVIFEPAALPARAQWYAGFSRVIVPLDLWFELPLPTREAIFRSAIPVVFFGAPTRLPRMSAVDRGLLPIEIKPEPMTLEVPWPYRGSGTTNRPVTISWTAKPESRIIGSPRLPYLASNRIAVFAAEEDAIRGPVPSFDVFSPTVDENVTRVQRAMRTVEIAREWRPAIVLLLLVATSVFVWIALTRRPRLMGGVALCAIAIGMLVVRQSVRASAARHRAEVLRMSAPGVVDVVTIEHDYGAAPLQASAAGTAKDAVGWGLVDFASLQNIEVRTSATAPGFGLIHSADHWDSNARLMRRRELGAPATIRIAPTGRQTVSVEYDSKMPVNYVSAVWMCGGKRCWGTTAASGQRRGKVTVRHATAAWRCIQCVFDTVDEAPISLHPSKFGDSSVSLIRTNEDSTTSVSQNDPPGSTVNRSRYFISAPFQRESGALWAEFVLPGPPPAGATVSLAVRGVGVSYGRASSATLSGEAGSVTLTSDELRKIQFAPIPFGHLRRIAPAGGVVRASIETSEPPSEWKALLRVTEEKP